MKRFLLLIMSAILACMAFIGCNSGEGPTNGYVPKRYNIEYRLKPEEGANTEYFDLMRIPNGSYPTRYTEGVATEISGLQNIRIDENTIYVFEGWYYDLSYKKLLRNNIISNKAEDIILYAKISEKESAQKTMATITYKWENPEKGLQGIDSIPTAMLEGIVLPTQYEEGVGVGIPNLKTWVHNKTVYKDTYRFEGWYYDANFKNKVGGNIVPTTKTGNLTLYADIEVWTGKK